ncbi:ABC transporter substrate-binding protein [Cohnella zeiphila]|uniref:ABC transporter substrate-binding protein n=1 Tax=Cohnella zeiphila TaxID=2761120 RepID=A0A7X0SNX3_9BACL|nr:ABC transporter substrate-binding protein [Cohnella zeiphila]MBB6733460.1 ABC transporter substrate-binding protein [Cohnella zeiphila]
MKRNRKALLPLMLTAALALGGCSGSGNNSNNGGSSQQPASPSASAPASSSGASASASPSASPSSAKLDPVKLKLILPGDKPQHYDEVMKVLNQKLQDRIQASLDIQYIPWDSYKDQILVKLAAGENFDFYYDGWWQNYAQVLAKGGALDITGLIQKYAPDLYNGLTADYVNSNKYMGKIYGIPVPGPLEYPQGYNFRSDIAQKYGYGADNLKTLSDAEAFMTKALAGEKGKVGLRYNGEYAGDYQVLAFLGTQREFIPSNDFNSPGMLLNNEPKVIDQFESQPYKDFLKLKQRWWNEGLIDKDSLFSKSSVTTDANTDTTALSSFGNPPEGWLGDRSVSLSQIEPGASVDFVTMEGDGFKMVSSFKAGNFTVLSPESKNPERVLMFLNLIYTDKGIRDLYLYGIENQDFIAVGDNQFKYPDGLDATKAFGNQWWMVTPWANARISANATETDKKFISYLSDPANFQKSVISGFDFNPDAVKSEISKVSAVVGEYRKVLESGSSSDSQLEAKYNEFIDKLKKAGVDKIIAEKQRQIDAFLQK